MNGNNGNQGGPGNQGGGPGGGGPGGPGGGGAGGPGGPGGGGPGGHAGPRIEINQIEIEEHTKKVHGKERPPKATKYVIRVDKTKFTVEVTGMTGREILALAGKTPVEQYKLTQKMHGGAAKTIGLDDNVDFTEPGVERFMTLKLDQTEG